MRRHVDPLPTDQRGQPAEQIDGGDHRPANAIKLLERFQSRRAALAPQPDVGDRPLSGLPPGLVDGVIGKHRLACAHQLRQQAAARAARVAVEDALIGQIVRCSGAGIASERGRADHQQIAIADPRQEPQRVAADLLLERGKQGGGLGGGNMAGGEVAHDLVFDRDHVAADGPVAAGQGDALRGGFQGSAARVMGQRIVAQQAEVGRVGAGRQSGRSVVAQGDDAGLDHGVHGRQPGRFQGRFALERLLGFVGTAVGDDDGVFHGKLLADSSCLGAVRQLGTMSRFHA